MTQFLGSWRCERNWLSVISCSCNRTTFGLENTSSHFLLAITSSKRMKVRSRGARVEFLMIIVHGGWGSHARKEALPPASVLIFFWEFPPSKLQQICQIQSKHEFHDSKVTLRSIIFLVEEMRCKSFPSLSTHRSWCWKTSRSSIEQNPLLLAFLLHDLCGLTFAL